MEKAEEEGMRIKAKHIVEGENLPTRDYGLAYQEYFSLNYVFYPIPFNYLSRYWNYFKSAWNQFRSFYPMKYDKRVSNALHSAYKRGYYNGLREGENRRYDYIINEIRRKP